MTTILLPACFAVIAALFACVGQAGGAGYVAVMGLFGFEASDLKVTALLLTFLVAAIGVVRFYRLGLLRTRDWAPFAILGVPASLAGGMINLPGRLYHTVIAVLLLGAAVQMIRMARGGAALDDTAADAPPMRAALLCGGATGLIAGITGIGAGVFLAAVIFPLKWLPTRRAAAVTQASNIFSAAPALAGALLANPGMPSALPLWALAAGAGGVFGAWLGSRHLPVTVLRYLLAAILIASGLKLAFS